MLAEYKKPGLVNECRFIAVRSSGPGGQNVNKVNTKIELRFSISDSSTLSYEEKTTIRRELKNRINQNDEIVLTSQNSRSQLKNKELAIELFLLLIESSLKEKVKRIKTKPTLKSKRERLKNKKYLSEKKKLRRNSDW